jgi:hypothetical protein
MANITKVPNGPLIKKKGPFKGSTLKSGGTVKKAQTGNKIVKGSRPGLGVFRTIKERTTSGGVAEPYKYKTESIDTTGFSKGRNKYEVKTVEGEGDKTGSKVTSTKSKTINRKNVPATLKSLKKAQDGDTLTVKKPTWQRMTQDQRAAKKAELGPEGFKKYKDSISTEATNRRVKATGLSAEQLAKNDQKLQEKMARKKDAVDEGSQKCGPNFKSTRCGISKAGAKESKSDWKKKRNGGPVKKAKAGAMIKRADGSMSRRGLWDNLRNKAAQNKKTGAKPKAPTKAMLTQEKKIKSKGK